MQEKCKQRKQFLIHQTSFEIYLTYSKKTNLGIIEILNSTTSQLLFIEGKYDNFKDKDQLSYFDVVQETWTSFGQNSCIFESDVQKSK
ncbi:unnamed protein product (macronuclear) [Paramecium tetraurelia]|uniref:Uncharacterized protein n=1 Tax=Paramecium tetraurelia TaxID=5888 RepID=A0CP01_PARTE|nr:uncharacterized protein GSPATT00038787001 [Paramecium tetraurelia]CAK72518.1 unnamed protein product [Paramecium tetraurelia]|eukprot:XP_001439915.1 hypothetical protein (macronuclear) [Paramecium tetraurelia strain d4-2]